MRGALRGLFRQVGWDVVFAEAFEGLTGPDPVLTVAPVGTPCGFIIRRSHPGQLKPSDLIVLSGMKLDRARPRR